MLMYDPHWTSGDPAVRPNPSGGVRNAHPKQAGPPNCERLTMGAGITLGAVCAPYLRTSLLLPDPPLIHGRSTRSRCAARALARDAAPHSVGATLRHRQVAAPVVLPPLLTRRCATAQTTHAPPRPQRVQVRCRAVERGGGVAWLALARAAPVFDMPVCSLACCDACARVAKWRRSGGPFFSQKGDCLLTSPETCPRPK